jgi:glycerol kinase
VVAVGVANQRETTIVWDRRTGRPIYNAISWQCARTARICEELSAAGREPEIAEKTGLFPDAYFSGPKLRWILENIPGAASLAKDGRLLFGTVDSWLCFNLSGGSAHITDVSNASRTMLFNINEMKWDEELCGLLDIPSVMLPRVVPTNGVHFTVSEAIPGIEELGGAPVCSIIGDQQAALLGQRCFEPGMAKNTYGTGCFLLANTGKRRVRSADRLLSTVAWDLGDGPVYAVEGSVLSAGSAISWLKDELGLFRETEECEALAASVADTAGVYFVPAFSGLGSPHWDMYARGAMLGLTRGAGRAHIARAALESIAYQVADLASSVERDTGVPLSCLRADGGSSANGLLMRFQADLLGVPVLRPLSPEATTLGAAYAAGLACGFWNGLDDIKRAAPEDTVFKPSMEKGEREARMRGWRRAVLRAKGWSEEEKA